MAGLGVAEKRADDDRFEPFLRAVAERADDDRPLVRKGASWALRQIGKRSTGLHTAVLRDSSRAAPAWKVSAVTGRIRPCAA